MPKKMTPERLNQQLKHAFTHKDMKKIKELEQQEADTNNISDYQTKKSTLQNELNSALTDAATKNNFTKVNSLLQRGADINGLSDELKLKIKKDVLNPALSCAFSQRNIAEMKCLLQQGADINILNKYGNPFLGVALDRNDLEMIELLLENGVNANVTDSDGETMLQKAFQDHGKDMIKRLLEKKADPNSITSYGTPFMLHVIESNSTDKMNTYEILKLLISSEADIHYVVGPDKTTILQTINDREKDEMVAFLIKQSLLKNIDAAFPYEEDLEEDLFDLWKEIHSELNKLQEKKPPALNYSVVDFLKETNFRELAYNIKVDTLKYLETLQTTDMDGLDYFKDEFISNLASLNLNRSKLETEFRDWSKNCTIGPKGENQQIILDEYTQHEIFNYLEFTDLKNIWEMIKEDREIKESAQASTNGISMKNQLSLPKKPNYTGRFQQCHLFYQPLQQNQTEETNQQIDKFKRISSS